MSAEQERQNAQHAQQDIEEPPPILGSWRNLYLVLIVELALLTLAGYLLTWWAA